MMKPILKGEVDYDPLASGPDNTRWRITPRPMGTPQQHGP